ncbi:helix-turn-helix domain-containing protein [Microvirga sp. VF16]|uniref:helix-turn-helix domain-containing protein n=1 Tax=Microvirga sp. VF16 TaxID=2807101 RepID=UPI00193E59EF|nr:helix-turn-helix domain-containing protein [Microvirga sp. VF16]QRM27338.1 helix-turn-helix domain-containing protein [Microvirga sp. VF16]
MDNSNIQQYMASELILAIGDIPTYALYGEVGDDPTADWVHCETIQIRSRLHNYRILPHRHEKLFQILHLAEGTAEIVVDGRSTQLIGPAIVTLPPMTVHGYTFSPDVQGTVLTLFDSRLTHILAEMDGVRETFRSVHLISLHDHEDAARTLTADIASLAAELAGRGSARSEAIQARLMLILIALHRMQGASQTDGGRSPVRRALQHALRFRELVDLHFRSHQPIEIYASRLGLTSPHLNRICREHLGDTALGVIHQRIILEAKRYLTFTSLSAKEIALALAFDDPAYFARFFKQKTGLPPLAFRAMQQDAMA